PLEEPEASEVLRAQLVGEGVELHLNAGVERVERVADEIVVMAGGRQIRGDALLVALGRRPRVDGLGLHEAAVAFSAAGIRVDRTLKTTTGHIYAAGDCTGGQQLTHYAAWQGIIAVRNAFLPGKANGVQDQVPGVTFTDPEVARAGMTEAAARERLGSRVSVVSWPNSRIDRALTDGDGAGFVRVVRAPDGRLVGATAVGPHAGEAIHEWVLAIDRGMRLADVASSIHAYPTYAFGHWQLAGEAAFTALMGGWKGRFLRWLAARGL
ncbi:MAG: FAD-dependent oxidoreductase, partial [Chloroflexota bacterium]